MFTKIRIWLITKLARKESFLINADIKFGDNVHLYAKLDCTINSGFVQTGIEYGSYTVFIGDFGDD